MLISKEPAYTLWYESIVLSSHALACVCCRGNYADGMLEGSCIYQELNGKMEVQETVARIVAPVSSSCAMPAC